MPTPTRLVRAAAVAAVVTSAVVSLVSGAEPSREDAVRAAAEQVVAAFNAGKIDEVAGFFLDSAELIDDQGNVYQGREQIDQLFKAYLAKYAGAAMSLNIESINVMGPVAIEEGTRTMTAQDAGEPAIVSYATVWAHTEAGWRIASLSDVSDDPPPTHHDFLQPLEWLIGEWINEGSDSTVRIKYQWSEDQNYILADFLITSGDETLMKSSQRIGWDPLAGQIRSWLFDADGGFSQGVWALLGDQWVIKSNATTPEGLLGTATLRMSREDDNRFKLSGTDRIIGGEPADDFEVIVTRKPPAPQQ